MRNVVAERIRPEGADVVFECVGTGETIAAALSATRKGGRAVVVGNAPPTVQVDGLELQRGDRSLVGVLMYERGDFIEAMDLLANGLLHAFPDRRSCSFPARRRRDGVLDVQRRHAQAFRAVVQP